MPFYSANIRLVREEYVGRKAYFVTICCEQRRPVFHNRERGRWVITTLEECCSRRRFVVHAFCAMPDHLHIVLQGLEPEADLLKLVENFKQRTGYVYRRQSGKCLWQSRYYDHILRKGDAVEDVACYVWWNPVRAGICRRPGDYPLSGSQTIAWIQAAGKTVTWRPPWKEPELNKE